jgi:transcriptional regulator with XRE-family HTH domain
VISGDLLREARLRAGLTQRELASRAGTTQPAIARWESGEVQPSLERLRELIRACGLELTFGLANYDESYVPDIVESLNASPSERIDRAVAWVNALRPWEAALGDARDE